MNFDFIEFGWVPRRTLQSRAMAIFSNSWLTNAIGAKTFPPGWTKVPQEPRVFEVSPRMTTDGGRQKMNFKRLIDLFTHHQRNVGNDFRVPVFSIRPENVCLIKTPGDFYSKLKELSLKSTKRISISSLYIGTDRLEQELIDNFHQAKTICPDLDLNILLDYNRATREISTRSDIVGSGKSSRSILLPLVNQGAHVNFYLSQTLSGWHRFLLQRPKWNELTALHHMKLYIFDNDLIISGANLSELYFTNRQDRYLLIRNSPQLCDYFDQLIRTVSKFSLRLNSDGQFCLHQGWNYDPRKFVHRYSFRVNARKEILRLNDGWKNHREDLTKTDTIVVPLLQMSTLGIRDEEEFTTSLLESPIPRTRLDLATGYFNLIHKYQTRLIESSGPERPASILMASETANGFHNGKGILRYIPFVYTHYVREFLRMLTNGGRRLNENILIYYYDRPEWSFHGKGIWLDHPQCQWLLTMVGSTNYGYRSAYRDNEAQIVLVTSNQTLCRQFRQEYLDELLRHSRPIRRQEDLPTVPSWVSLFARMFRSFF